MKLIYIPIEIKARELTSKLFFISENINENFVFFIGNKLAIRRATSLLGSGVYFYKSINYNDIDHIKRIKKNGNIYVSLDEEGGVTQSNKSFFQSYLNYKSSYENLSLVDKIFTWGDFDYEGWCKKYKNYKTKITKTGSPRFDLWRKKYYSRIFKEEISYLNKYSPYFFIPSTFISSYNWLQKEISNEKKMGKNNDKLTTSYVKRRIEARKDSYKNFLTYVDVIKKLSNDFPNHKIIIKPHPTENILDWEKKFINKKYSNIIIHNSFDLTSYIAASDCVIFSESSAGIQSMIMGKKTISFNLKKNITFRNFANKCTPQTSNYKTLLRYLNSILIKKKIIYKKNINNRFYIPYKTSSKIIMKNIKNIKIMDINFKFLNFKTKFFGTYYFIKDSVLSLLSILKQKFLGKKTLLNSRFSYKLKMPGGIKRKEIKKFFRNLSLEKKIKIINFGKDGYLIYKKNN